MAYVTYGGQQVYVPDQLNIAGRRPGFQSGNPAGDLALYLNRSNANASSGEYGKYLSPITPEMYYQAVLDLQKSGSPNAFLGGQGPGSPGGSVAADVNNPSPSHIISLLHAKQLAAPTGRTPLEAAKYMSDNAQHSGGIVNSFGNFASNFMKSPVAPIMLGIGGIGALSALGAGGLGAGLGSGLASGGTAAGAGASAGGLGSMFSSAGLGSALKGAALGGITSGISGGNPLKGAILGGLGGFAMGGGIPGLGSFGGQLGAGGMGPPTPGSGIFGAIGNAGRTLTGGLGNILGGGGSSGGGLFGGSGSFGGMSGLSGIGNVISGALSYGQAGDTEDKLLAAQKRASGMLSPYNATGLQANQMLNSDLRSGALGGTFNPGDLTQDEGYQFRLAQGQQALERSMAARGMGESGAALKAAQDYGQGLAAQTYNDAYQQWLQQQQARYGMLSGQSGQGLQAAGGLADIAGNVGNIQANAGVARNNILGGTLSSILGGGGFMNSMGQQVNNGPRVIRDAQGNVIGYM